MRTTESSGRRGSDAGKKVGPQPPSRDFEATIASATAFLYAASVMLLTRRLGRST